MEKEEKEGEKEEEATMDSETHPSPDTLLLLFQLQVRGTHVLCTTTARAKFVGVPKRLAYVIYCSAKKERQEECGTHR